MHMHLLLLLCLALSVAAWSRCRQSCDLVCRGEATECTAACVSSCESGARRTEDPYLSLEFVTALDADANEVTGSDSPNANMYFTTRNGKVYRFDPSMRQINVVHTINPLLLDTRNNKGLYDIKFHGRYDGHTNRRVYLQYATPSDEEGVDHYNVIAEYDMLDDQASGAENFRLLRTIKRIPQINTQRSGGWLGTHLRSTYEGDWLYFATGGNIDESVEAVRAVPYLSTVWGVRPDITDASGEMVNRRWASGVKNPISCDASFFEAGWFHCLLEDAHGAVHVQKVERGFNYGSPNYVRDCKGENCDSDRPSKASRTAPLTSFAADGCPVHSLQLYTGSKSIEFKLSKLMIRSSCYSSTRNTYAPLEIRKLYSDKAGWDTVVVPTRTPEHFLVNASLVGADRHDALFVSGYSLHEGRYNLYRVNFIKP